MPISMKITPQIATPSSIQPVSKRNGNDRAPLTPPLSQVRFRVHTPAGLQENMVDGLLWDMGAANPTNSHDEATEPPEPPEPRQLRRKRTWPEDASPSLSHSRSFTHPLSGAAA